MSSSTTGGSGPDMSDCMLTLKSLESYHAVKVTITLCQGGMQGGLWALQAVATRTHTNGTARLEGRDSCGVCLLADPVTMSRSFSPLLYRLLLELDVECSRELWVQKELLFKDRA